MLSVKRVLDAAVADLATSELFFIGTRGAAVATGTATSPRAGRAPCRRTRWVYPSFADRIAAALYARIGTGEIDRLDAVFSRWRPGDRHAYRMPPAVSAGHDELSPTSANTDTPLVNLPSEQLLSGLTAGLRLHAQLCSAALCMLFAAENEARMAAMVLGASPD